MQSNRKKSSLKKAIEQEPTNNATETVTSQEPINTELLEPPTPIPGVPIGLEPLIPVDRILVKRLGGYQDYYSAVNEVNRFETFISTDQRIYVASETADLAICVLDSFGRSVMTVNRRNCFRVAAILFVTLGDESKLGGIAKLLRCCTDKFVITDDSDTKIMEIEAPCCGTYSCCSTEYYPILTNKGKQIASIRRSRTVLELLTGAENFQVEFSPDLNVRSKALVMAAVFLIDFIYCESTHDRNQFRYNENLMAATSENPTLDLNSRIAIDEFFESEVPNYTSQLL